MYMQNKKRRLGFRVRKNALREKHSAERTGRRKRKPKGEVRMKKKRILLSLLCALCAGCFVAGFPAAGNAVYAANGAYREEAGVLRDGQKAVREYTVGSVSVHHTCKTNNQVFVLFYDGEGNGCDMGYTSWVVPDAYTEKFEEYLTVNGEKMSDIDGVTIQGMDIPNALCIAGSGFYLPDGGKVVIPKGAVFENGSAKLTFDRTYTIVWDGEAYSVEAERGETSFPDYTMEEGMLSDFTDKSVIRLGGQNYHDAVPDKDGWNTNYHSFFQGGFVSAEEAPEGSVNGGYKFSWNTTTGLLYPSIMFRFRNDVAFESDDELVFRIYFSETLDKSFNFWITSSTNPRVWEAENMVSGLTLTTGGWNEIRVPVADYLDKSGKIAPIAFTLAYNQSFGPNEDVPGGYLLFDTAVFRQSVKVVDEDYKIYDISEVVPLQGEKTYTGELDAYSDGFDYKKDCNIAFARTDKAFTGMKVKVSVSDLSRFSFYFVLNGTNKYFVDGGIYYWFNNDSVLAGTATKTYINEPLPATIEANKPFLAEMICAPYYVDGIKAGNYVALKIDGKEIGSGAYVASANCNFGTWTGLYLHNTTKDVGVTVAPVRQAEEPAISLNLSTSLNATALEVGETLGTKVKITGKLYKADSVKYVIVSGDAYAGIDDEGYVTGKANGKAVVKAVIENEFGTFSSNEIELTIGTGEEPKKTGCKSSVGGGLTGLLTIAGVAAVLRKKKR